MVQRQVSGQRDNAAVLAAKRAELEKQLEGVQREEKLAEERAALQRRLRELDEPLDSPAAAFGQACFAGPARASPSPERTRSLCEVTGELAARRTPTRAEDELWWTPEVLRKLGVDAFTAADLQVEAAKRAISAPRVWPHAAGRAADPAAIRHCAPRAAAA